MKKINNPVAKFNNEFNKPKVFRNRKKKAKMDGEYGDKPQHEPYKRDHKKYNLADCEDGYDY